MKGVSVHVSNAAPKTDPARQQAGFSRTGGPAGRDKGQSPFGPANPSYGGAIGLGGGAGAAWNQPPAGRPVLID